MVTTHLVQYAAPLNTAVRQSLTAADHTGKALVEHHVEGLVL